MKQPRLLFSGIGIIILIAVGCRDKYPGFTELDTGLYRKLHLFGEDKLELGQCDFFQANIYLSKADQYDSVKFFSLQSGQLQVKASSGEAIDSMLYQEISKLKRGDSVSFILPYANFTNTFIDQYRGNLYEPIENVRLTLSIKNAFEKLGFLEFAMVQCQQGKMDENFALEYSFINEEEIEKFGDVYIRREGECKGDSISAGKEVHLKYNTFLFDNTQVDTLTEMIFPFGRPGQLLEGFHFGLSKLCDGQKARIYMPSYLAFGKSGSATGLIPPGTPVYFEVSLLEVLTERENSVSN